MQYIQQLKENRVIRNIMTKDKGLILMSTGILLLLVAFYLVFLYKPAYQSRAKVWIKDSLSSTYMAETEGRSFLKPLTASGNPILTQIELLKSHDMEVYLEEFLQKQQGLEKKPNLSMDKLLKIKAEPGTDIIQLNLKWHDPVTAQTMLGVMLERLNEVNLSINREIQSKRAGYLDEKLAEVKRDLLAKRQEIRNFQESTMTVDVDEQTRELVRLRTQFLARLGDAQAARSNAGSNASDLQRQLAMSPRQALNAVALGSGNKNLVEMRTLLNTLKQQYSHDSIKLAPTNPKMTALKQQIDTLETQIRGEIRKTIGSDTKSDNMQHIFDPVRENLVSEMSTSRAKMSGFSSEAGALRQSLSQVDEELKNIPESRYRLATLQQEEKALALAFDELKRNQIEARIKEAETSSNVFIVDSPSKPESASFPSPLHILALSLLLGLASGVGLSVAKTHLEDHCEGVIAVEQATRSKVLGVLPWHQKPLSLQVNNKKIVSIYEMAYKHILANLKRESKKPEARVLAFTSTAPGRAKNSVLYDLATRMAKRGETVALLNVNFSLPARNKKYQVGESPRVNLPRFILEVDRRLRQGESVSYGDVIAALTPDRHGVQLGFCMEESDGTTEYFDTLGFRFIIQTLKQHFDWVLIDTPSVMASSEFMGIAHVSDGVVLFVNKAATHSELSWISRKLREENIPLIGSVIREEHSEGEDDDTPGWHGGGGLYRPAASVPVARRVEFFGAKIDALTMEETCERIVEIIDEKRQAQHVVVNVAKLIQMQSDPDLKRIVNNCDIVNADGAGIVLGARLMNLPVPERVTGIDLMSQLIALSSEKKYRIFFLGAEEGVIRQVVSQYKQQYPDLEICGYRNGYFSTMVDGSVAEEIRQARPDILFVGMSSPRKEKFLEQYKAVMNVPFVMGVGGSFDIVAGKTTRAPLWMQSAGMEWLYRLGQEPERMWKRYMVSNAKYGWMLSRELLTGALKTRPTYGTF